MTEEELIQRVKKVLRNWRYVSEVPAHDLNPNPISKSKPESDAPRGASSSSYRTAVASLIGWCETQEKAHQGVIKGPDRKPETPEDFAARILAHKPYEGMTNKQIADAERVSESWLEKAKHRAKKAA